MFKYDEGGIGIMSRVIVMTTDIAVLEAAIAKHPEAEIHWAVQDMPEYRNRAKALGLGRYSCVGKDVDTSNYDHVMKAMPRTPTVSAWTKKVEVVGDEEE